MHPLQGLGLSFYESKSLDILLKEPLTPKSLAKMADIPLGKVYSVIKRLKERGFIAETSSRPKTIYVPDPAVAVKHLIEQKQKTDEKLFSTLRSMAAEASALRSTPNRFFQLGTTQEENRDIQLRTFLEAEREVCQVITMHHKPSMNRASKTLWEDEIGRAVKRGVRFRCIYPEKAALPERLQKLPKDRFQVRRLDTGFTRCDIIDGRRSLVKLVHHDAHIFGGIIFIEDERFARNLQSVFEGFWDEAKK